MKNTSIVERKDNMIRTVTWETLKQSPKMRKPLKKLNKLDRREIKKLKKLLPLNLSTKTKTTLILNHILQVRFL